MLKTIAILTPGFPENEQDTTCLPAVQNFILELRKVKPEVIIKIISLQYPFNKGVYFWNGIEVFCLGGKNRGHIFVYFLRIKAYNYICSIHKQNPLAGILSLWMTDTAVIGQKFHKQFNTPHFIWMHGQDARMGNKHVETIKPQASQIIAISHFLQTEFQKNYGIQPGHVIENGIIETEFPELNKGERTIDVCGVGNLTPLKNYKLFIEIISDLKLVNPLINAVIIGEGVEMNDLQDEISKRGLEKNITLMGKLPHLQVLDVMNKSKVFLHTSSYEGNSGVLIEALYSGCIAVSRQSLSNVEVKNLVIGETKQELITGVKTILAKRDLVHERVLFNSMNESAKKIANLFSI